MMENSGGEEKLITFDYVTDVNQKKDALQDQLAETQAQLESTLLHRGMFELAAVFVGPHRVCLCLSGLFCFENAQRTLR